MKRRRKNVARMEASKKIVLFCDALLTASIALMFMALFMGFEISGAGQVIISLIGLSAAGHGFYFWKAKCENVHKIPDVTELIRDGKATYGEVFGGGNYV